jgi:hypothetical protein
MVGQEQFLALQDNVFFMLVAAVAEQVPIHQL